MQDFLVRTHSMRTCFILILVSIAFLPEMKAEEKPINLGLRRELFVDDYLIEDLKGAEQKLHRPIAREVAIVHDAPCEGNISYYHTVFRDGEKFRMYYRGAHSGPRTTFPESKKHQVVCYAESNDGITWTKPNLGLHEFAGSKENNVIWTGAGHHNFAPFLDSNPDSTPQARYKALGSGKGGLVAFQSADAIHWSLIRKEPVITKGAFDSQNLAFYDNVRNRYIDFHRGFENGKRAIMTCTSEDFINWTEPEFIRYDDDLDQHLYTNQIASYPRAPHLFFGFPKRFLPSRNLTHHTGSGASDILLITSRDGENFHRWNEAFIRPGLQRERWVNRNNFVAHGFVETSSQLDGVADELSFYSMEGYYSGNDCRMRRYSLRPDGFVSINAPFAGGEVTTKAITFDLPAKDAPRTVIDLTPSPIRPEVDQAIRGKGSLAFSSPAVLKMKDTQNLGKQVTLAVSIRGVPRGHRRLFSTYNGGPTTPNELYFDINAGGPISKADGYSIRFNYNGVLVGATFDDIGDWSDAIDATAVHHLAATWNDGEIAIYFDGKIVAEGGKSGAGDLVFETGDLHFGEDCQGTSITNEPFLGLADDVLVLRRALSEEDVAAFAKTGKIEGEGILLNFDDPEGSLTDQLKDDGTQFVGGPVGIQAAEVSLLLNYSTSAAGSIRCEIQDDTGKAIPGFSLKESDEMFGDSLERAMTWGRSGDLKTLVGKPIRLRFELKDADLFSLRFGR